jgi:hypothetical protein
VYLWLAAGLLDVGTDHHCVPVAGLLDVGTDHLTVPVAGLLDVGTDHYYVPVAGLLEVGTDPHCVPVAGLLDVGTDHLGCVSQHFSCLVSCGTHRAPHLFHSMARLQETVLFRHIFRAFHADKDSAPDNGLERQINDIKKYVSVKIVSGLKTEILAKFNQISPFCYSKGGSGIHYTTGSGPSDLKC